MKRRKFIQSTAVASALPLTFAASQNLEKEIPTEEKELYELRTYEMKFRGNRQLLVDYLKDALHPALQRLGVNHFLMFEEMGKSEPNKMWTLISYPNAEIYLKAQNLAADAVYQTAAKSYHELTPEQAVYSRFSSSLLLAFDGLPKMLNPMGDASIFELRIYEGYSEDAVSRKIKMFNQEEIELFYRTKLHPVFFGEMISGPHRPNLTYLLNFKDMKERDENWSAFIKHPDWNRMKVKEEYANSISNIRKIFLQPI